MAKKHKKKFQATTQIKTTELDRERNAGENKQPTDTSNFLSGKYFVPVVTALFFLLALSGMLTHEMWRDEHQAWLVARDADSLTGVFRNMKYEGNPALWQMVLFIITRFTHNPVYMQVLHLGIATGFIFVFNKYAPVKPLFKVLFTLGYFPLYEYAVISRSYGLGILLLFIVCALFKNRTSYYILMGVLLALLANVTIYEVIISLGIGGILLLDYIFLQNKSRKLTFQLITGGSVFLAGVIFSLYQIAPEPDNSFPAPYATDVFDFPHWAQVASRLFTTYFYIPSVESINFWNTNIYFQDGINTDGLTFYAWLKENPVYLMTWVYMPVLIFLSGILVFLKKPLIMLLYVGLTLGLLSVFYYTSLYYSRYVGHLFIVLIACWWLAAYYPAKQYHNILDNLARFGSRISKPFLVAVLSVNVIGALVAYSNDLRYKFTPSKDAADFIRNNKLDTLTITGTTDFTLSSIASYLNAKIFYPQMNDFGSFCIWNKHRKNDMSFAEQVESIHTLINKQKSKKLLWIKDNPPFLTLNGRNAPFERGIIGDNIQVDLLRSFETGIVPDEKFSIFLLQVVDTSKIDYSKYPLIN